MKKLTTKELRKLENRIFKPLEILREAAKEDPSLASCVAELSSGWSAFYRHVRGLREAEAAAADAGEVICEVFHPPGAGVISTVLTPNRVIRRRATHSFVELVPLRSKVVFDYYFQEAQRKVAA